MSKLSKEQLEKELKTLFPFHYENEIQSVTRVNPIFIPDGTETNFENVCETRGLNTSSKEYELLKKFFYKKTNSKMPPNEKEEAKKLAQKYFPEMRLGSVKSNSKKQSEDNSQYVTPTINKKIDASKVVKLKKLPGEASNLSIIATQWPRGVETIDAFWDMVCHNNSKPRSIVCLADPKAPLFLPYWIAKNYAEGMVFETACYKVTSSKKVGPINGSVDVYNLTITYTPETGNPVDCNTTLYYYKGWPDGGLPTKPSDFESFVKHLNSKNITKLVAHCYAGAGRTGVFCACLYALRTKQKNVAEIVKELRTYRTQMIQQAEQFDFTYKFILRNVAEQDIKYGDNLGKYLDEHDVNVD